MLIRFIEIVSKGIMPQNFVPTIETVFVCRFLNRKYRRKPY